MAHKNQDQWLKILEKQYKWPSHSKSLKQKIMKAASVQRHETYNRTNIFDLFQPILSMKQFALCSVIAFSIGIGSALLLEKQIIKNQAETSLLIGSGLYFAQPFLN